MMERHFYAVVTCKNKTCLGESAVKYLGARKEKLKPLTPRDAVFSYKCPQCREEHEYAVGSLEVRSYGFDPPPDWADRF